MEVILVQDVKSLGKKGDVVKVSDGYARNIILPKKLGVEANAQHRNDLKLQKANEEKVAKQQLEAAREFAKELETKEVVVKMKAGEGGRVFGSVSSKEIAQAAKVQCGMEIDKKNVIWKLYNESESTESFFSGLLALELPHRLVEVVTELVVD